MVRTIEVSVKDRIAWQTNRIEYICGNSDFVVDFAFDDEWANADHKTARFIHGEQYTDVLFTGNQCEVPVITGAICMKVGVYAGNLRTTTAATVLCKKSILCDDGTPADPPPDVYTQVMEFLNKGVSAEQINQAVADYLKANPVETGSKVTNGEVELLADKWEEVGEKHYSQVVQIKGVTDRSQIDPTPDAEQLAVFYNKEMMLVFENEDCVVTAHLIGQRLENDYVMQVTITDVRL
jgi:hypothetical protein